jgi:branched-chain amino acid transport system ATP-binding protein
MALFEAHQIHKRFGDHVVLEEINLRFEENELSGIMGPNGAGKTTCFNVLTGLYKPNRGKVIFDGRDVTGLPPRKLARLGISRSFQVMNVFDEYTALDNVLLSVPEVRKAGMSVLHDLTRNKLLIDKAAHVLARVGLAGKEYSQADSLSYGERRALEIGIALAAEPRILFLDEPTAGLGTEGTARLADMIHSIKDGLTIVIIEHDMHFLFGLANNINVVQWGQVVATGTPDELKANKWVQASNLGKLAS